MSLNNIKLIVSEMDGIVTEHSSAIGEAGITMFKNYNMKDFEAINKIKKHFNFVFLSSDPAISLTLCRSKSIPFFYSKNNKKKILADDLLKRYNATPEEVIYLGSTYSDIDCMRLVPFCMCPDDAVYEVKEISQVVIPHLSGTGVLCWLYTYLEQNRRQNV